MAANQTKTFSFVLLFLGFSLFSNASDTATTWKDFEKNLAKKTIKSSWIKPLPEGPTLASVEVLDKRTDTERIGMYATARSSFHQVFIENGLDLLISEKLTKPGAIGDSVLIVVKDLWMNEFLSRGPNMGKETEKKQSTIAYTSKMVFKADVFIQKNDGFFALARIDTVIIQKQVLNTTATPFLEKMMVVLQLKIQEAIAENRFKHKTRFEKAFITNSYNVKFDFEALVNDHPKKGIYTSFNDFKNNTPKEIAFAISKPYNALYLLDQQTKTEILTRDVWGVCDGKYMYIMQHGSLFPLIKNGSSFYWLGLKETTIKDYSIPIYVPYGGAGAGFTVMASTGTRKELRKTPYLLNLESGKEY